MASSLKIATILILCLIVTEPFFTSQAAITCGSVAGALSPCISYLQRGGRVSRPCCGGVRRLVSSARTTCDRQTACRCLKSAADVVSLSLVVPDIFFRFTLKLEMVEGLMRVGYSS
ncbi:unnamed protein product [Rhodiola kirilowii]